MKIAFLGSSEFSKVVLQKLVANGKHKVVCVVCNLDKSSGRGQKIQFSPVKVFAIQNNIPVLQYARVSREGYDDIKAFNPDVLVTASFSHILKQNILDLAPYGVLNVHPSLLPKYRGSCPVNWTLIKGEKITGVTIMKTDIGLDSGDIILQKEYPVSPTDTTGELSLKLADFGADLLIEALDKIETNTASYTKQDESKMSYYPMLDKNMGKIDFSNTAEEIVNLVRGLNPWPLCFVEYKNRNSEIKKIKVFSASIVLCKKDILSRYLRANNCYSENDSEDHMEEMFQKISNGTVVCATSKTGLIAKAQDNFVLLDIIQAENGKKMSSRDFLNGTKISVNTILNEAEVDDDNIED